ncbi:MAG: CHAP domain-containing protein, partial [Actinomycetota bacterium]|nr:CHAP domain-containing protein [Actinomycetota bacterium]
MRLVPPIVALAVLLAVPGAASAGVVQDRMVSIAMAEARRGVQEVPARSNDGPAIRRYRTAVRHAERGAWWCTIFVSYVARRAGYPIGSVGQGIVEVRNLVKWGRKEGFVFRKGSRRPRPGDIALHGLGHTGIVVSVAADGTVHTVDANWSDTVS